MTRHLLPIVLVACLCPHFILAAGFPDCANGPLKNNTVCDTSKSARERAQAVISLFTDDELMSNMVNESPGVPRLGLPSYNWWSEALHGVASSPGVTFAPSGNFSSATSFPQPILLGAAFDDALIKSVATVISTEARAFNNFGRSGLDYFTPNINPFKDPRWGRGQETPGEDPFHISQYVLQLIDGLQGGIDPKTFKVAADCKHFAAYDLELWQGIDRFHFDATVTPQDLSEFYLPPFQTCVRDAKVASVMCSYNEVNGVPSCANSFLLQDILRDLWGFDEDRWVTSDCDAVDNIFSTHNFTSTAAQAAADALKAGTDVDCGSAYALHLPDALSQSLVTRADLEKGMVRLYTSLVRLGYFDPPESQAFRQIDWADVNVPSAQALAHQAAVEGIVVLKNDGILPLSKKFRSVAVIGPWANATTQMQGNYHGVAPFLVSPFQGAVDAGFKATFAFGTSMTGTTTDGFAEALSAARGADLVIFAGGIDEVTVEREGRDRTAITWPGNQLDLLSELQAVGKPIVVLQFGGGQVDDTSLKNSRKVNAIVWGGYPGQSGGTAVFDILTGKVSPAGRLPTTQYEAGYVDQVPMTDMTLRPTSANPGRTYQWYSGTPVFEFGHGLHFTTFALSWQKAPKARYSTSDFASAIRRSQTPDLITFDTFRVTVRNTGSRKSDFVALLFASGNAGPAPRPNKRLVSYTRLHGINTRSSSRAELKVTLGSLARADTEGNTWLFPGDYVLTVDTPGTISSHFRLEGNPIQLSRFPQNTSAK
ncbi:hypothetical protein PC9H_004266 [Pleurotus ostreatus]|uniref:xylan 1,4-beta-xylosidase n=1 Tax=Pleurotus ostreatus TaxID=5322 RepID=A0A8H7A2I4_PLEOS|nr:uncharacterized protein PC9H_004266 [Pleurotus ostreatus]KAF7437427.1 hypothetical protein PC9H_004266 [Pleurotus ostreatus]KAJ8703355.1 hypothetical protein PTI98_001982 [Pleurotus ostreatus]